MSASSTVPETLPASVDSSEYAGDVPSAAEDDSRITQPLPAADLRPRRIAYVVDDSDDARELFGEALSQAGYRVVEATDGRQAVDLLLDHPTPSAIVLDLIMPRVDGYEVLDLICSYTRLMNIPTIVVTACTHDVELPVPFGRCLRKPLDGPEIVNALDELLAARELRLRR
jgi:CheY-like chemotaxis protein